MANSSTQTLLPRTARIDSIDLLRGIIMVVMALDHVRDFFHFDAFLHDPTDMATTTPILFGVRWISHFCAPIFVLLMGVGARLQLNAGKTKAYLSRYLISRGLFLILLEFTLFAWCWSFRFPPRFILFAVIWVLGISMVVLAGLLYVPRWVRLGLGIFLLFGHNFFDGFTYAEGDPNGAWWHVLHQQGMAPIGGGFTLFAFYPLMPWLGIAILGFELGSLYANDVLPAQRKKWLALLGVAALLLFVLLRGTRLYGEPSPWEVQPTLLLTLCSFVNCTKYPPSLLYSLMTLGPGLLFLAFSEQAKGAVVRFFTVFGRVPMFYYLLHLPLLRLAATAYEFLSGYTWKDIDASHNLFRLPTGYGIHLWGVAGVWVALILLLYPICRLYMNYKRSHVNWFTRYV